MWLMGCKLNALKNPVFIAMTHSINRQFAKTPTVEFLLEWWLVGVGAIMIAV